MSTPIVIIHHDNCPDGWGAAWWLGKHVGDHVKVPGIYGQPPPYDVCLDAEVWLVDFCYPGVELQALAAVAKYVNILDHHETAVGYVADSGFELQPDVAAFVDLGQLGGLNRVAGVLDMDHSGVGLVAAYVRRQCGIKPPKFLANIEDRDLWRFSLDDTRDVFAAVTSRPYTVEAWDGLLAARHEDLVTEGKAINRYRDQLITQVAASTFDIFLRDADGYDWDVPCASSPYAIGSDVAGLLAERSDDGIGAYCILHADCVQVGLRSRGDGPNVARIAQAAGGGGHPHASGFKVPWSIWEQMVDTEPLTSDR